MRDDSRALKLCNDVVRFGIARGAFEAPRPILAHVEQMVTGGDCKTVYVKGYETDTYLVTPQSGSFSGIVIKIVPDANVRLAKSVAQEATVLRQVYICGETSLCVWPTPLAFYQYEDAHVSVLLKIAGSAITCVCVDTRTAAAVAQAICEIQRCIGSVPYGRQMLSILQGP